MGLTAAYGPFLPAVYHPFVLREAGWAPQKGLPEHGPSKEPKISQRIVHLYTEPRCGAIPRPKLEQNQSTALYLLNARQQEGRCSHKSTRRSSHGPLHIKDRESPHVANHGTGDQGGLR